MFELNIPDAGLYPFVTHSFAYTGLGAVGLIKVDPSAPDAPSSYPLMSDPFSAGVTAATPPGGGTVSPAPPPASPTPSATPSSSPTSSPTGGGSAPCTPNGTQLKITALNTAFSTDCLAVAAGTPFTILFDNQDAGIPHNLSIYTDESATKSLFTGEFVTGPKKATYKVDALDAGTYFFRCDVHPTTMTGTFVVQ
jgi:plastocyanin